jgi:uncharacterized protein (DUF342 family)
MARDEDIRQEDGPHGEADRPDEPADRLDEQAAAEPSAPTLLADCLTVRISRDGMLATVTLTARPDQVEPACGEDLARLLGSAGVRFGIVEQATLDALIADWVAPVDDVIVAIGKHPTAPTDDEVTLEFDPDPQPQPEIGEDDRADFRELGLLQNVSAGDVLALRIPGRPGNPGVDVYGREVAPKPVRYLPLPAGRGTVVSEDGLQLLASGEGQVVLGRDGRVAVLPVYHVKGDVDFSTGNIDFRGSVVVMENVLTGFTVKATGNIEVRGIVEAANLVAGGDIIVRGGIQGSTRSSVVADGSVRARYLQNATVRAGTDVIVDDSIMHARVTGTRVRLIGRRALLVGGSTQAREAVIARIIGSHLATRTPISLGPDAQDEQELLEVLSHIDECELAQDVNAPADAAVAQKLAALHKRRDELQAWLIMPDELSVQALAVCYPGVVLQGRGHVYEVGDLTRYAHFSCTADGWVVGTGARGANAR